jgi:hypothetical protein
MKIIKGLCLLAAAVSLTVLTASAGTICPGGNTTNFFHDPDPTLTGCNSLITIDANNTVTITVPDASPYDGSEDTLVGVLNNSATAVSSINLSGLDIFGLDGDGVCTFTFAAANGVAGDGYCAGKTLDPADYFGPTSTFTITDASTGIVNFGPAVAGGGGNSFFSLEEPPTASLTATVGGGTPEPASAALIVSGIGSLWLYRRRRS